MNKIAAKQALDKVIDKARVHLYKPIQIAELQKEHLYMLTLLTLLLS